MNQVHYIFKLFLNSLDIKVPNSIIIKLLNTPIGMTMRGISDALDSLNIENNVYLLPKEHLNKIEYPYLIGLSYNENSFAVITNDNDKKMVLPKWNGMLLKAKKTDKTSCYKHIWLQDFLYGIYSNKIQILSCTFIITFIVFLISDLITQIHTLLSLFGLILSIILLKKEYNGKNDKYCKIGKYINCEAVIFSKGSKILNFKLSSLVFMFYNTQLFSVLFCDGWFNYSILLLIASLIFTIYSVLYQIVAVHKICIYCMLINLIVWIDFVLLIANIHSIKLVNIHLIFISSLIALVNLDVVKRYYSSTKEIQKLQKSCSILYMRDVFNCLLAQEKYIEDINDIHAKLISKRGVDSITFFIHPKCENCKIVYDEIPMLKNKAKIKIVSLATENQEIKKYCSINNINRTPTILVNGRVLPAVYNIEDLKYII